MTKGIKYTKIIKLLDLMDEYDLFMFDLWGVLLEGDNLYSGVCQTVNTILAEKKVMFISNSSRTSESTYQKLKGLGLNIEEDMVITAGRLTKNILMNPAKYLSIKTPVVYNLGLDHNEELWDAANLPSTKDIEKAGLMIISMSMFRDKIEQSDYDILRKAAELKIPAICSNNDRIAVSNGKVMYCAGHFAEKFESFGGEVLYVGKPFEPIFEEALSFHPSIKRERVIMIGDTITTDVFGAINVGIHSGLVTTGNVEFLLQNPKNEKEKLLQIEKICTDQNIHPNYIVEVG
jgi:HAD superfamily hydrolase (TIGR01459 family)